MKFFFESCFYLIILILGTLIPVIIAVAFFTLSERRIMAFVQRREGPNVVGIYGVLQPIADALKLLIGESIYLRQTAPYLFIIAATLPLIFSLLQWSILPLGYYKEIGNNSSINILYLFPIAIGSTYGVVLAGWASNSKYATIGSLRSVVQLASYDIPMVLSIIPILIITGSLNISEISYLQSKSLWFFLVNAPAALCFFITALAETNRAPFDLPEAEAELVAGFNVEYSAIIFSLFFLGEYSNMLLISLVYVQLFFSEDTALSWLFCIVIALWGIHHFIIVDNPYELSPVLVYIEYIIIEYSVYVLIIIFIITLYSPIMDILYAEGWYLIYFYYETAKSLMFNALSVIKIPYSIKVVSVCILFIITRAIVPRYRYDQLMNYCWKVLIPFTLSNILLCLGLFSLFNGFITNL